MGAKKINRWGKLFASTLSAREKTDALDKRMTGARKRKKRGGGEREKKQEFEIATCSAECKGSGSNPNDDHMFHQAGWLFSAKDNNRLNLFNFV